MRNIVSDTEREELVDRILAVLHEGGAAAYFGEPVTQLEHALQTAALAEGDKAPETLIVAALLHDIGHLLAAPDSAVDPEIDAQHEEVGDRWLSGQFGPAVTEPIRLHVAAKRYLCAVEPGYAGLLSAASRESLMLQGGPMTADEARVFRASPWALEAAVLRGWDDCAKAPGLAVPGLSHYRSRVERLLESR